MAVATALGPHEAACSEPSITCPLCRRVPPILARLPPLRPSLRSREASSWRRRRTSSSGYRPAREPPHRLSDRDADSALRGLVRLGCRDYGYPLWRREDRMRHVGTVDPPLPSELFDLGDRHNLLLAHRRHADLRPPPITSINTLSHCGPRPVGDARIGAHRPDRLHAAPRAVTPPPATSGCSGASSSWRTRPRPSFRCADRPRPASSGPCRCSPPPGRR